MTQVDPRIILPELSPEEREAQRQRALKALERVDAVHKQILERRGGRPIEVDDILDELRGERGTSFWQS
jgi:hypothetical protein